MNERHLRLCASPEWAETVQKWTIPWVLEDVDLGDDVLEVGPGPGLTTDILRTLAASLTALEVDRQLADALARRLDGTNVEVVCADAANMPLPENRFSGVICLTMLHHVPTPAQQDAVFAEMQRVLRPGGVLVGQDSLATDALRELHSDDTYVPVDPAGLPQRLAGAGFSTIRVDTNWRAVRFRARKP